MKKAPIIISLGGSLIVPKTGIDIPFLAQFKKIILNRVAAGERFIIICGGGSVARQYQTAASELGKLTRESLDWVGIHATRLNAHLVRMVFLDQAFPRVVTDPKGGKNFKQAIMLAAGWKPGCSTDFDAVLQAAAHGVKYMYNLSNTDYVYDKDPNKFPDAKPYKEMDWKSLREIVGNDWDPGLHVPFDPIASKRAEKIGLEVRIINGKKLDNFSKALSGKDFIGTRIHV
ncbi:MAG: UMP kinase [bacterium]